MKHDARVISNECRQDSPCESRSRLVTVSPSSCEGDVRSPSSKPGPPNRPMKRNSRCSGLVARPLQRLGRYAAVTPLAGTLELMRCSKFGVAGVAVPAPVRQAARPPLRPGLATVVPPALRGAVRLSAALGGPGCGAFGPTAQVPTQANDVLTSRDRFQGWSGFAGIAAGVVSQLFLLLVEFPILIEVAAQANGAQSQYCVCVLH
jgi:hypothetical protein